MTKRPRNSATAPDTPARWIARPSGGSGAKDRLAALLRATDAPRELGPAARARVWSRLARPAPSGQPVRSTRLWRAPFGLRWTVAGVVLLTSGAVIGAVTAHRWWAPVRALVVSEAPPTKARPHARHVAGQPALPVSDQPELPSDETALDQQRRS